MDDLRRRIVENITILDGVAIFFIVLYHVCDRLEQPYGTAFSAAIGVIGLSCFTFSAGLKFSHNHYATRADRDFLGGYFLRRFVRLYKAYVGFSVLMAGIIGLMFLVSFFVPGFYPGLSQYSPDRFGAADLIAFLAGTNPVAFHLWYLVALLAITAICFTVLYSRRAPLPLAGLAVISFDLLFWSRLQDFSFLLFRIMAYLPVFVGGIYWEVLQKRLAARNPSYMLPAGIIVLFGGALIWEIGMPPTWDILALGLTVPAGLYLLAGLQPAGYLRKAIAAAGSVSFPIYLFHPLVLNVFNFRMLDFLKSSSIISPLPITIAVMVLSAAVYWAVKKVRLNVLFE